MSKSAISLLIAVIALGLVPGSRAATSFEQIGEFNVPEANQGVGVDERHFYAAHSNYKMTLPEAGSVLELVEVVPMNIRGQGIAWDRSQPGTLYGIVRATARSSLRAHLVRFALCA